MHTIRQSSIIQITVTEEMLPDTVAEQMKSILCLIAKKRYGNPNLRAYVRCSFYKYIMEIHVFKYWVYKCWLK